MPPVASEGSITRSGSSVNPQRGGSLVQRWSCTKEREKMRSLSWALLLSLLVVFPASAQETRGNISGTVQDAEGVVPGATVKITSVDTGASQQLVTNSRGYFEAPLLQPGNYSITVEMAGFK